MDAPDSRQDVSEVDGDLILPTAKVKFIVSNDDGTENIETLWAFDLGNDLYRLDNRPWYAYGVSCGDTVYAPYNSNEQFPTFQRVVSKSGNRTVRIVLDDAPAPGNHSEAVLKQLVDSGYGYEGMTSTYLTVESPPQADFDALLEYLTDQNIKWEHADPTYDEWHNNLD